MIVGIYYSGQGGDAARALAGELRAAGHKALTRDSSVWLGDSAEPFDEVVILPGAANQDALRAAYGARVKADEPAVVDPPPPPRTRKNPSR